MNKRIYLSALIAAATFAGCASPMMQAVKDENVPKGLENSVLLVERFEQRDPDVYDPFYSDRNDSLRQLSIFSYSQQVENLEANDSSKNKQHPLIIETNQNLEQYNSNLQQALKAYPHEYKVVSPTELENSTAYGDMNKYRYILRYKPVIHCYHDPEGFTHLDYRYVYYFHDRQTGNDLPYVEVFSPQPWKTVKAIGKKESKNKS